MARLPTLTLLVVLLAACSSSPPTASRPQATSAAVAPAPVAPGRPTPAAQADVKLVDPAVISALQSMGSYLQTLKRYAVAIDLSGERVLSDGQKLQHTATADLQVSAPNELRAQMYSARGQRELIYDGKTVTLYQPLQKYYSQAKFADTNATLVDRLRERYGVEIPSVDLFLWGTPAAPLNNMQSAMNAGQDIVDGTLCDHYAIRQGDIDWQIWIAASERPLPCKLVITDRADEARPQSVTLFRWNLSPRFTKTTFTFTPPKDAREAKFVPLKSAQNQ